MVSRNQQVAGKGARSSKTRGVIGQPLLHNGHDPHAFLVGVYDWSVREDRLRGDTNLARLFSVPPEQAAEGLPLSDYLKAINPEDLNVVEVRIASAVERHESYAVSYRVRDGTGWRWVNALGRCYPLGIEDLRFSGVVVAEGPKTSTSTSLPRRELECLHWCSEGKTNWEIGRILGISERTVEHHIASAVRRLDCSSRVQAVAFALRLGLIR